MARTVKMCDMSGSIAAKVFEILNTGKVTINVADIDSVTAIITDTEPQELVYPEGWYYANGRLTNKHNSTTGMYDTVLMFHTNGDIWEANYCTAD